MAPPQPFSIRDWVLRASFPPAVSRAANGSWLSVSLKPTTFNNENLVTENKKLQARVFALAESRTSTRVNHVIDRLDNVIKVVNSQAAESYQHTHTLMVNNSVWQTFLDAKFLVSRLASVSC